MPMPGMPASRRKPDCRSLRSTGEAGTMQSGLGSARAVDARSGVWIPNSIGLSVARKDRAGGCW